jgi:acetyl-CoA carboxylase carboxyl transferase subunit alpha
VKTPEPLSMLDRVVKRLNDPNGSRPASTLDETTALTERRRSAWEAVQVARNVERPHTLDVVSRIFTNFQELHGDRAFRDDPAIVGGLALFGDRPVVVIGHQKGATTEENIHRNFGMPHPEGFRKALRLMRLAEKFGLPVVSFIDTPGAYPGPEAEERGQSEAIAHNILKMATLRTPIVVIVLGEGGSGGALALGVGDVVLALENAIYSVISPEGCAAILWRSSAEAERAAEALKLAAPDLLSQGVIDGIIREPPEGAHTDHDATARNIGGALADQLERITSIPLADLVGQRYERFRRIGVLVEEPPAPPPKATSWWERILRR